MSDIQGSADQQADPAEAALLARPITEALIAEGWTCASEDPDEAEFLPVSVERAVARILALYDEVKAGAR